jgi:hypothetical protein
MENILQRIKQYADYHNISIRSIEAAIGASNGVISSAIKRNSDIQSKWVSIIIEFYKDINPTWLLTGKGSMLIDQNQIPEKIKTASKPTEENEGVVTFLQQQIKEKDARIEILIAENAVLRHRLHNVRV